jgi:Fe-S-cluster-containing dehydrogenase component
MPVCVLTCITGARHFGDLDDPKSELSRLIRENDGWILLEELGTKPSVYYTGHLPLAKEKALELLL